MKIQITSFIKSLDFYGISKNFTINSEEKFKTLFGGFISILIFIFSIFLLLVLGKDFLNKKNPNGYSSIEINPENYTKIMDFEFFVGFQVLNFEEKIINFEELEFFYPMFTLIHQYHLKNGSFAFNEKEIPFIKCDKFKINNKIKKSIFDLSKFLCPDISKIVDLNIGGDLNLGQNSTELNFKISFCNFNKEDCKDGNKFKELTQNGSIILNILYPEILYNIDNYENPFNIFLKLDFTFINYYSLVMHEIVFSDFSLEDDRGGFFESKDIKGVLGTTEIRKNADIRLSRQNPINNNNSFSDSTIFELFISKDKKLRYYHRSYLKLTTIVANVGSLVRYIISIMSFVYSYFNKFKFDSHLCNRLLFIEDDDNLELSQKDNKSSNLKRIEIKKELINYSDVNSNNCNLPAKNKNEEDKKIRLEKEVVDIKEKNNYNISSFDIKNDEEINKIESDNISNRALFRKDIKKNNQNLSSINKNNNLISNDIKSNIDITLNKLNEYKNKIIFNFIHRLFSKKNQKIININEIFDLYSKKINEKFEIFHYFQLDRKSDITQRYLLNNQELNIIDILSKKNYKINFKDFEKNNHNEINNDERNKKIFEYLLLSESDLKKEKILEILLN
jgi:hypothetical protein